MMKELKFRAWLNVENKMIQPKNFYGIDYYNGCIWYKKNDKSRGVNLDGVEIMQYTGLKDKNGVEIYEGDEIELTHSDLEGETIYSKAIAKAPMDYTLEEAVALNYAHEIELTGKNIYENSELLEVE